MIIDRVTYTKTFSIGPYLNEKIGVEIQLDASEEPEDALDVAKRIVESWHKENNSHLDHSVPIGEPLPVIKSDKEPDIDAELQEEMNLMNSFPTRELAEAFLSKSPFKYRPELKNILNNKFPS